MMAQCEFCDIEMEIPHYTVDIDEFESSVHVCEDCYYEHDFHRSEDVDTTATGELDVTIDGGVTCQNCYSVIFDLEKLLRHIAERPACRRFSHSDEIVIDVEAYADVCSRCGEPSPEHEFQTRLLGEDVSLCNECIDEVTSQEVGDDA